MPPLPPAGRRVRATLLLAAVASTCLAACGASDSDNVKDAVRNYIQAVLDANGKTACNLLTADATKAFTDKVASVTNTHDCATAFNKEASTLTADEKAVYRSAVLKGVTVNGNDASVTVQFTGVSKDIALKKVNGDWKIATGPVG
jgi:hypothetical protein